MERRTILAFALSALVLFGYVWVQEQFFAAAPPQAPAKPVAPTTPASPTTPPSAGKTEAPAEKPATAARPVAAAPGAAQAEERPRPPARLARVESPLYHGVISSEGGKLQEWALKYRGEKPLVILGDVGPTGLRVAPAQGRNPTVVPMRITRETGPLGRERAQDELVLEGDVDGLTVRETLRFRADSYTIDTLVRVENRSS